jgi:hypothetical protein
VGNSGIIVEEWWAAHTPEAVAWMLGLVLALAVGARVARL